MGALSKLFSRFQKSPSNRSERERRGGRRLTVDCLAVAMVGGRPVTVHVENMSAGGAFVCPRVEGAQGSSFTLRFPEAGVSMLASIAHQRHHGTGVYFSDSTSAERVIELFAAD
tara:strand:+ start:134 stop:475 length:342 start_codon:yes stop_codon:yes gene_type:complete